MNTMNSTKKQICEPATFEGVTLDMIDGPKGCFCDDINKQIIPHDFVQDQKEYWRAEMAKKAAEEERARKEAEAEAARKKAIDDEAKRKAEEERKKKEADE